MAGKGCIIPLSRKGLLCAAAAALLAILILALAPRPGAPDARTYPEGLNRYGLTLRLDDETHTLAVTETLRMRNGTGDRLGSIVMRTWLNAFAKEETSPAALDEAYCYPDGFSPGFLTLYDVLWNGEKAEHAYVNADETALEIFIPGLEAGEEGTLTLRCVAQLPPCAYRTGWTDGEYRLGNVIPLLSRYEDGAWRTDGYAPVGDPFVSDCADFTVELYAPEGWTPACSAPLTREGEAWRGRLSAARDMALCVYRQSAAARGRAAGVNVTSYAATAEEAGRALKAVCRALETFAGLYGPAPYADLAVCRADLPFGGMEYPGLLMLGKGDYLESRADTLELTAAHETAHQWFYALVGSDQADAPWQDEALCEYAMLRYVRACYGTGSFETLKAYRVDASMRENIPGALTPGSPIAYFASYADYSAVVYGRGAALLLALDEMLPGGVDGFLRAYAEEFAFRYASRKDFEECLGRYAGMDVGPLLLDYLDTAH